MIITLTEIKEFLNIKDTASDLRIEALIDPVLYDVFDYTQNWFHNNAVKVHGSEFVFSTAGTITADESNLTEDCHFAANDVIHVEDSFRNDGVYVVSSVTTSALTLSTTCTLTAEADTYHADVTITKVEFPQALKPIVAAMIKHRMDYPSGVPKSESLADYSIDYGFTSGGYPDGIAKALNKYRRVRF